MGVRILATCGFVRKYACCPKCFGEIQYYSVDCENGSIQYQARCSQCDWFAPVPHIENKNKDRISQNKRAAWGRAVIERDGYRCRRCGSTEDLEAHHIQDYANHPALRFDLDNGITLCRKCHDMEHPWRVNKDWRR